jgi:hypothetical protein
VDIPPELCAASVPEVTGGFWRRQLIDAREWCTGRLWWARLPLWLYLAYSLVRHATASEPYRSVFDGLNLGIHELGHVIFRPFGQFLTVAGGTIAQCMAPIISVLVFHRQRDWFGISVCVCWLATNLWGVSVYLGDARALELPLVAPGMGMMPSGDGSILHDWNHLLGITGLLRHAGLIAGTIGVVATLTMLVGLAFGAWLLLRMALSPPGPFDPVFSSGRTQE